MRLIAQCLKRWDGAFLSSLHSNSPANLFRDAIEMHDGSITACEFTQMSQFQVLTLLVPALLPKLTKLFYICCLATQQDTKK